jgi:hypothetical protein
MKAVLLFVLSVQSDQVFFKDGTKGLLIAKDGKDEFVACASGFTMVAYQTFFYRDRVGLEVLTYV